MEKSHEHHKEIRNDFVCGGHFGRMRRKLF